MVGSTATLTIQPSRISRHQEHRRVTIVCSRRHHERGRLERVRNAIESALEQPGVTIALRPWQPLTVPTGIRVTQRATQQRAAIRHTRQPACTLSVAAEFGNRQRTEHGRSQQRQRRYLPTWGAELAKLRGAGHRLEVMFLDAKDDVLLRRFSETRRRHPLSGDEVSEGIRRDRELLAELRVGAAVVDTSNLTTHQFKAIIQDRYGGTGKLAVTLVSFGWKHGAPVEFNLVFDVRFLPNPYFEPTLTHKDGRDPDVARFVCASADGLELVERVENLLRFSLPQFQQEGKLYVTVAVGCTGGRHRSVAIVEELRRRLGGEWDILVRHRDVDRGE